MADSSWEVRQGDCRDLMRELEQGGVSAIVTSPPYADQRNYEGGGEERATARAGRQQERRRESSNWRNQSRRKRSEAPMRFAREFVDEFLPPMFDVLADDGSLMLNLGIVMRDGEESPYADFILAGARELGFKLLQRIIWFKPNGGTPSNQAYMRMTHEWVFWLAKSIDAYRGYDRVTRSPHKESSLRRIRGPYKHDPDDERYAKRSGQHPLHPEGARPTTVFECAVGGEPGIKHPAKMPLKLARHLVALSAPEGAVVLDPFGGSCTTGVAALQLGRDFVGLELEPGYLPEAHERLEGARRSPLVAVEQMALLEAGA